VGSEIIEINSKNDNNFLNINTKEDLEKAKKKIK
jgi:molybdopterin-guanine dinucleotide biosynthesis protein A